VIDWETTAQAAARAKRHPVTVRRAAEAGLLHGHQGDKGGRWAFDPTAVDAWVQGRDSTSACGCRALRLVRKAA